MTPVEVLSKLSPIKQVSIIALVAMSDRRRAGEYNSSDCALNHDLVPEDGTTVYGFEKVLNNLEDNLEFPNQTTSALESCVNIEDESDEKKYEKVLQDLE